MEFIKRGGVIDVVKRLIRMYCGSLFCNKPVVYTKVYYLNYILKRKYYSSKSEKATNNKKMIIAMCDEKVWQEKGGFTDNIQGLLSIYQITKELGYDFKIYFTVPFDLTRVLLPNQSCNWIITKEEISYNTKDVTAYCLNNFSQAFLPHWVYQPNEEAKAITKFLKGNYKQIHVYTNSPISSGPGMYGKLFSELFTLNPTFESELLKHMQQLGEGYISVATRLGVTLGDFKDCCGIPISLEDQLVLLQKCKEQIEIIHQKFPGKKILLTSDSKKYIDYIREQLDYTYSQDEEKIHFAKIKTNNFESSKSMLVDYFLISKASHVFQLKSKEMFGGKFSKSASEIEGKPFEVVEF